MEEVNLLKFPIKALLSFLIFTEILYFVSPIAFPIGNYSLIIMYFLIANLFLYIGYLSGLKPIDSNEIIIEPNLRVVKFLILSGLLLNIPIFISGWDLQSFSIAGVLEKTISALVNPGDAYHEIGAFSEKGWIGYFNLLFSPLVFLGKTLGLFYWRDLDKKYKTLVVLSMVLSILYWVGIGTRKGIIDNLLILATAIVVLNPVKLFDRKNIRIIVLLLLLFLTLFFYYFIYSNLSRSNMDMDDLLLIDTEYGIKEVYLNYVSPYIYFPLIEISSYLCQGYQALTYVLVDTMRDGIFCFTYGFGNNFFVINVMEHLMPDWNILDETYQGYLEEKYQIDPLVNWHSIYVWLANDFTLLGVFPIMFIIGRLLAISWVDTLAKNNQYAYPLFVLMVLTVFYFFANNQVFSFSFLEFCLVFFLYMWTNRMKLIYKDEE